MQRKKKDNVWNDELNLTAKSHGASVDVHLGMRDCQLVDALSAFNRVDAA